MAWSAPASWAVGQVVTAADLNQELRDNVAFLGTMLNAAGGGFSANTIIVGNATGTFKSFTLGDGEVLVGSPTAAPVPVGLLTTATGYVQGARGGLEADISSHAKGGLVSFTGAAGATIVSVGADGEFLKSTAGAVAGLEWVAGIAQSTVVSFSRTEAEGSGTQVIGGVSFAPNHAIAVVRGIDELANWYPISIGIIDSVNNAGLLGIKNTATATAESNFISLVSTGTGFLKAGGSLTATGINLLWTAGGGSNDPTATGYILLIA